MSKNDQCYFVNMFQSPAMIEKQPQEINVINLYANNLKMLRGIQPPPNMTQESMCSQNFLSLFHLFMKQTKGVEPLVYYSQSHVTFVEYLYILWKKMMDKAIAKEIKKEEKRRGRRKMKHVMPTNFKKLAQGFSEWDDFTPIIIDFQALNYIRF